jgi:hypothetical protein
MTPQRSAVLAAVAMLAMAGCGDDSNTAAESTGEPVGSPTPGESTVIDPGDEGAYEVEIDPARFGSVIDNPYLPKRPGMRWTYIEVTSDGELEHITVEVLDERRIVMGVETIVVHDVVTDATGEVIEDTYDWFAQDDDGNVWYFGEDTTAYRDGVASHEGAWEAGVDGALPGIVMPGDPQVTPNGYRQEYLAGEAEDMGQVVEVDTAFDVPAGSYDDVVRTRDWTPLEPDVVEYKAYAPGVGWIHETKADADGVVTIAVLMEHAP